MTCLSAVVSVIDSDASTGRIEAITQRQSTGFLESQLFRELPGIHLSILIKTLDLESTPGVTLFVEVNYENCSSK